MLYRPSGEVPSELVGWKGGLRAIYCIVRYSPVGDRRLRRRRAARS